MPQSISKRAASALQDDLLRTTLTRATGLLNRARAEGFAQVDFAGHQAMASSIRQRALDALPDLLQELETQVTSNGAEVLWALDAADACRIVVALAQSRHAQVIVRSRSTLAEEIGLDAALGEAGLPVVDTELGDVILQLAGDDASHPVYPALHWRKEDVAALFTEKLDMPETVDLQSMAGMARFAVRSQMLRADMSIGGVDLAVAETGVLALASDSGADRFGLAMGRLHVALMGIDQVVSSPQELFFLLQLKARSAHGAALAGSVTLLDGPARPGDPDGPDELVLVIVDNGRSDLLRWGYGEVLACIDCGACLNACPVYREIGGVAYGGQPAGPIGAVSLPLTPAPTPKQPGRTHMLARLRRPERREHAAPVALTETLRTTPFADLPAASTLCGACRNVCPVGIDLPHALVRLRGDLAQAGRLSIGMQQGRRLFAWAMSGPESYGRFHRWLVRGGRLFGKERIRRLPPPFQAWADGRDLPAPAQRTFRERWRQKST